MVLVPNYDAVREEGSEKLARMPLSYVAVINNYLFTGDATLRRDTFPASSSSALALPPVHRLILHGLCSSSSEYDMTSSSYSSSSESALRYRYVPLPYSSSSELTSSSG